MEGQRSVRALVATTLLLVGCQVRGLVGSNESAASEDSGGATEASDAGGHGSSETRGGDSDGTGGAEGSDPGETGLTFGDGSESSGTSGVIFDVGSGGELETCAPPSYAPCDGDEDAQWQHVIGLCGDEDNAHYSQTTLDGAVAILDRRLGGAESPFSPREGHRMLVVTDFCGHGLGQVFHAPPNVLHYGRPGTGAVLEPGMFFTIEPMVNLGRAETKTLADDWTAVTRDKSLSAQFEHSVGVTEDGVEIFTLSPGGLFHPTYKTD